MAIKIAVFGLSNAGKTSILSTLVKKEEDLQELKPTLGVKRTQVFVNGRQIVLWDFGGQDNYQERYLGEPTRYFEEVFHIFYVIDIQDDSAWKESASNFLAIYDRLQMYSPTAKISILYHKHDPDIGKKDLAESIRRKFENIVKKELGLYSLPFEAFYTTIYEPASVFGAFEKYIQENSTI